MNRSSRSKKNLALGLPETCPTWCVNRHRGHREALEEGCGVVDASRHVSSDLAHTLPQLANQVSGEQIRGSYAGGWDVSLVQDGYPTHEAPYGGPVFVELETQTWIPADGPDGQRSKHVTLPLTTGEARSLAAQLVHLADAEDLP